MYVFNFINMIVLNYHFARIILYMNVSDYVKLSQNVAYYKKKPHREKRMGLF